MKSRMMISSTLLAMLMAGMALMSLNSSAEDGPDETPFGFDDEYWYSGRSTHTNLDISIPYEIKKKGPDAPIDILIQFYPPLTEKDLDAARDAGFEILHRFSSLPAVAATGDRGAIEKISRYGGLFWMESDMEMEYLMEKTTTTINASKTWKMPVIDSLGKEHQAIDGQGIIVVVLDSGIDAGHPDLDYGEKVIKNYKSNSDFAWREVVNGDTSSGHGTHCAGTVAGNGDASSGARAGVAKGAKMIGLSTGEAVSIINAYGAMEWVYEHSKPGHTYEWQESIRVVSNSWGPSPGDYDPQDSISIISQKLTFENNVLVVFAASNSGGDGSDIQTNPYGNVPSNIAVAAIERDGSAVASFSSRGELGVHTTYPDVGAPGVGIWSTAARRTLISMSTKQGAGLSNIDPYYFAISGTSMATPHVAGVIALLLQAYPDLKMSTYYEQAEQEKIDAGWENDTRNRVHEVELILEASTTYLQPSDEGTPLAKNNVPQNYSIGWNNRPFDFAQGFGLVNVDRAVGIALALKEIRTRDFNGDGVPDYPDVCVKAAIQQYENTMVVREKTYETNRLYASWDGEWSRFSNQTNSIIPMNHDISKMVMIPEGTKEIEIRFTYDLWDTDNKKIASLFVTIDQDGDSNPDWSMQPEIFTEARIATIPVQSSSWGQKWSFNVEGRGIDWDFGDRFRETQFKEVRSEFTISLNATLSKGAHDLGFQDPHAGVAYWKPFIPFDENMEGNTINMTSYVYDLKNITPMVVEEEEEDGGANFGFLWILIIVVILGIIGYFLYTRYIKKKSI